MTESPQTLAPPVLLAKLERTFFWWEPVGSEPRSEIRILAQAMNFAPFRIVRNLETEVGPDRLADVMAGAQPGWFSDRSWEFWRGRLMWATGRTIAEAPPRRSFNDADP